MNLTSIKRIICGDTETCCDRNGISDCNQGRSCPTNQRDYTVRVIRNDGPVVEYQTRAETSFAAQDEAVGKYGHQTFVSVKRVAS